MTFFYIGLFQLFLAFSENVPKSTLFSDASTKNLHGGKVNSHKNLKKYGITPKGHLNNPES